MAVYYVSPTGSNSAKGSIDSPFASLQYAHDTAKPGDTIYMRGGVYKLTSEVHLTNDGTSGNPITVTNYQNEVPILDGSSMKGGYVIDMDNASWNHIKGLEIRNGPEGGLMIEGESHFNTIEQLNVHHNGWNSQWEGKGIVMFGASSNNLLLNNDSHHNQDLNLDNADGFQVSTTGTGNVLRGNRAWANSDDGYDFFNVHDNTDSAPLVLEGNWAFGNGYANDGSAAGDGNGFKLGGARAGTTSTSGGHIVTGNVAWGNRSIGFDENSASDPITLKNNTAYNNGLYNYGFWEEENTFRNNLSAGNGKVAASGSSEGNSWTMPVKVDSSDFLSLNDSTARGARAADGSLPTTQFLHLATGSDLVNLGAFQAGGPPAANQPPAAPVTPPADDIFYGTSGADVFHVTAGADTMSGYGGSDTYSVDNAGDKVTEAAGGGNDKVLASVTYALSAGSEVELLATTNASGTTAINLTGNEFAQTIQGNAGANVINGLGGADTMVGYGGNDTYYVDNAGDKVTEAAGGGNDKVLASVTYALSAGSEVELLATTNASGTTAINLTGNEFAQTIQGNAGANVINGLGGADTMVGYGGNDTYYVDNAGDKVTEAAGGGNDKVLASVTYALSAGSEVELLATTNASGTTAINLTGNEFAQTIQGNAGANVINGLGGADTMVGYGGNDTYYVDNAGDKVTEAAGGGSDKLIASLSYVLSAGSEIELITTSNASAKTAINLTGNEFAQTIQGNAGANIINGGAGADTLTGNGGKDIFVFNTAPGAGNIDKITDFSRFQGDKIQLDDAVFTGLQQGNLQSSAFFTGTAAHDSTDRIIYNSSTGALYYDSDGIGGAAQVQVATISGTLAPSASSFFVV